MRRQNAAVLVGSALAGSLFLSIARADSVYVPNGDLGQWTGSFVPGSAPPQYWMDYCNNLPNAANGAVVGGAGPGDLNAMHLWAGYNNGNNTPPTPYPVAISIWTLGNESQSLTQDGMHYTATVSVGEWTGDNAAGLGVPAPTFRVGLVDVRHNSDGTDQHTALGLSAPFTPTVSGQWYDITTPVAYGLAAGHGLEINLYVDGFYGINGTSWNSTQAQIANFRLTADQTTRTWSGTGTEWDTSVTKSWAEGDQQYHRGDAVVFDDTAAGKNTSINVVGSVQPGAITVNNTTTGASTYTIGGSGAIGGSTPLLKQGSGTLRITNANTYTGTTTVAGGTLLVSNATGSATGSGGVIVQQGAMLGGSGTIAGTVDVSGTISPSAGGATPAALTTGSQCWNPTGVYSPLVTNATGAPGAGWDQLVISGSVQQLSGFTIQPVANGMPANIVIGDTYNWIIAQVTSGAFDTSMLTLDASHFNTGYANHFLLTTQNLSGGGQALVLQYYSSVPEATTLFMGMAGLAPLVLQRRARRPTAHQ